MSRQGRRPAARALPARPRRAGQLPQQDLTTEYVFYDTNGERFHVLNETARAIVLLCDGSRSIDEIAATLAATHSIGAIAAREDVAALVADLVRLGLVLPE